jgi:hypothetical protein
MKRRELTVDELVRMNREAIEKTEKDLTARGLSREQIVGTVEEMGPALERKRNAKYARDI